MKLAIVSNVNMDYVGRLLKSNYDVLTPEGYGAALEQLLDSESSLNRFRPEAIVILTDLDSLVASCGNSEEAQDTIKQWYKVIESTFVENTQYFLADWVCHSSQVENVDESHVDTIEYCNYRSIKNLCEKYINVHRIRLRDAIGKVGIETCFSKQLWYTGKIVFSNQGCKIATSAIKEALTLVNRVPKKVLALDLDNTLWGGVLGERGFDGIDLSDDKVGAIYKDSQRLIKKMSQRGVILTIISKNNESDVIEAFEKNHNMVLRMNDFSSTRINWLPKADNLIDMAKELNLSLDSFVFVDDMTVERESVKAILPMVETPEFPTDLNQLPAFFKSLYDTYFRKLRTTKEDSGKAEQYQQNHKRAELEATLDYDEFLETLMLQIETVSPDDEQVMERVFQIFQKTNQFHTTTIRYTREELQSILKNNEYRLFVFRARDKYGDYGIIAAVIVSSLSSIPCIENFAMSCRIMGKRVENYILDYIEEQMNNMGMKSIQARYCESAKNAPVKALYDTLGYERIEVENKAVLYELSIKDKQPRKYYILGKEEN